MKTFTALLQVLIGQAQKGITKYGVTLDESKLSITELIEHSVQEKIDDCMYMLALKDKVAALMDENKMLRDELRAARILSKEATNETSD